VSDRERADAGSVRRSTKPADGAAGAGVRAARVPAIDRVKGVAIVGVLCIHASILQGAIVGTYLVNRAVPVFIVLFGTTSALWWRAQGDTPWTQVVARWYASRLSRLMVPFWAVLCVWWATLALVFGSPLKTRYVVASVLGYAPSIGTSWFVTAIVQLVVLFPLVRWTVARLGGVAALAVGLALLAASYFYMWDVIAGLRVVFRNTAPPTDFGDFYYFWLFAPRYVFGVVAGIVLARSGVVPGRTVVVACAAALALIDTLHATISGMPRLEGALLALSDPALTVCLLALLARLPVGAWATGALEWLGRHSWGIYLGQMLAQGIVLRAGVRPELLSTGARWLLLAYLLVAAWILVRVGTPLRRWLDRTLTAYVAPVDMNGASA
jgi:peptidoglycan/LPS O-acetylase OafA/YrhL